MIHQRFAILALIVVLVFTKLSLAASEGSKAPEFSLVTMDGSTLRLSQEKGKVLLIHFWATWCEACQLEMPLLQDFVVKHQSEGLEIIAISMDQGTDITKAKEVAAKYSFKSAFFKDAELKGYGRIWKIPLSFVIDREGILRKDGWDLGRRITSQDLDEVLLPLLRSKTP